MENSGNLKFNQTVIKHPIRFCCFPNCDVNSSKLPNTVFFKFPEDKESMAVWCMLAGRLDWMRPETVKRVKKNTFFCPRHFADNMFVDTEKTMLKDTAYPHSVSTPVVRIFRDPALDSAASSNKTMGPFVKFTTPTVPQVREQTKCIISTTKCSMKFTKKSASSLQPTCKINSPCSVNYQNSCIVSSCSEPARRGSFLCTDCEIRGYKACAVNSCQKLFRTTPPDMVSVAPYKNFPKDRKKQSKWKRILGIKSMHHIDGKSVKLCRSDYENKVVCFNHFGPEQFFIQGCLLKKDAIPFSNTAQESSALCITKKSTSLPKISSHVPPVSLPKISSHVPPVSLPEISSHVPPVSLPKISSHVPPVSLPKISSHVPPVNYTVDTNSRRAQKKQQLKLKHIKAVLEIKKLRLINRNIMLRNILLKQRIKRNKMMS